MDEWNARVQITTWGNRVCANDGGLRDYAHKEWNGLLKDFYYKRWAAYWQSLSDRGRIVYNQTIADFKSFDKKSFAAHSQEFLNILLAQDRLLGTRSEFRVERWIEQARNLGTTPEEKDLYEWNARVQITTWGNRVCANDGGLRDYAHKEWNGLLKDFYYKRWAAYWQTLQDVLDGYL